ncbi:MAG TPA: ribosome silencing factor [Dongiaceae bacterium]|nr:ribosome silencing factor [Dongiaceae bacterium]
MTISVKKTTGRKKASVRARPGRPDLLATALRILDDDKAENVVTIDLHGKSLIADHMIVATGRSSRQLGAMAQHLEQELGTLVARPIGIEGKAQGDWVLVDAGDIIIHLFRPEIRALYNLEKMWGALVSEVTPS